MVVGSLGSEIMRDAWVAVVKEIMPFLRETCRYRGHIIIS